MCIYIYIQNEFLDPYFYINSLNFQENMQMVFYKENSRVTTTAKTKYMTV